MLKYRGLKRHGDHSHQEHSFGIVLKYRGLKLTAIKKISEASFGIVLKHKGLKPEEKIFSGGNLNTTLLTSRKAL